MLDTWRLKHEAWKGSLKLSLKTWTRVLTFDVKDLSLKSKFAVRLWSWSLKSVLKVHI